MFIAAGRWPPFIGRNSKEVGDKYRRANLEKRFVLGGRELPFLTLPFKGGHGEW